jgi:hypothetical protein
MSAITNPTVNSYKRLNAPVTLSGATWAPNTVTWSGNNRTHMVRVPGPGRFELRLPDGAANPYLLQAVIIAAGLDGLATDADPGKRHDIDMYAEGHKVRGAVKLPLNMLDALRAYDKDTVLKSGHGQGVLRRLPEAQAPGMDQLRVPFQPLGKGKHARHLGKPDAGVPHAQESAFYEGCGGEYRNRTGVHGFAIRCVTTPPTRRWSVVRGYWRCGQGGACGDAQVQPQGAGFGRKQRSKNTYLERPKPSAQTICWPHVGPSGDTPIPLSW